MTPALALSLPSADAPAAAPAPPSRWWVRWGVVIGLWSLVLVADTTQSLFYFDRYDPERGLSDALVRHGPMWGIWALFTPLVIFLAARFPLERGTLRRNLPLHVAAALALAMTHHVLYIGQAYAIGWMDEHYGPPANAFFKFATGKTHVYLLVYFALVGAYHAAEYHRRFRERELAASQLQARLTEAHLQALKTQLHPHFLFNTLNAVSVLTLKGETQCAIRMLSRLSDLLRLTLESSAAQEVTLREELDFLEKYLEIEKVRFQDRLTVEVDVDAGAMDASVPNLLMQPLVENAVRHGVARQMDAGKITVRAAREGDRLKLEVRDTGPGLPPGGMAEVHEGIGLSNTRARLERLYPGDHRFELADVPGVGGALVTIDIPFRPRPASPRATSVPPAFAAAR
jgi:two-component system, LytTR family, sensor kinase